MVGLQTQPWLASRSADQRADDGCRQASMNSKLQHCRHVCLDAWSDGEMKRRRLRHLPMAGPLATSRFSPRRGAVVLLVVCVLTAIAPGQWAGAKENEQVAIPKGSAAQILHDVFERVKRQGCFTAPLVESWKGVERRRAVVTACKNSGSYTLVSRTSKLEQRVVDGKLYINGNARALLYFFNAPEREFAGKWIEIPATSKFAQQVQAITLSSAIRELQPIGPLHVSGRLSVNGKPAFAITGVADRTHPSVAKLFVSLGSPQLPVLLQSTIPAVKDSFQVGPIVWGGMSVMKPKASIALSSIHQPGTGSPLPPS